MKDILASYASYHYWANSRIAEVLQKLPDGQLDLEIPSSFNTLRQTVYHLWDSESAWYQRLQLAEQVVRPAAGFEGNFAEACRLWLQQSRLLEEWVQQATVVKLEHVVAYYNWQNQYCKSAVHQMLLHVFNHASYHRGQLVTMLRQAGITKIPVLDYIVFTRSRKI